MVCSKIPYGVEQGIFSEQNKETGIAEQGTVAADRPTGPTGVGVLSRIRRRALARSPVHRI